MSKKVTMLKGLPASGKSTWAKEQVKKSQGGCKRVNKDDLRTMIDDGQYSKGNERFVLQMRNNLIYEALKAGKHVIVDDTNLAPKHESDIRTLVADHNEHNADNVRVEVKVFDTGVEECIARDLKREASVGSDVILKMARQWSPDNDGYHECVPELDMEVLGKNGLPWCIIYDLDGTAAIMGDRSPYDATKCDEVDRCNHALRGLLCMTTFVRDDPDSVCPTYIALSGRGSEYRAATERFI